MDLPRVAKCRLVVCVVVALVVVGRCLGAPLTLTQARRADEGRIFWSGLGDILEALPFLPFTVNVPDALSAAWSYVSGWLPGASSAPAPATADANKKKPKPKDAVSGDDLLDYFLYDR